MSRTYRPLLLAIATLLPIAVSSAAQLKLLKAASDHFEIYTTDNDAAAKAAIEHFEAVRAYLLKATGSQDPFKTPVRIFGFKSHGDFSSSLPKGVAAEHVYSKGEESSAFILMDGIGGKEGYEYGVKEYVDLLFERTAPKMPFWLRLGFDGLYSTLRPGNGTIAIGEAPHLSYRAGSAPTLSSSTMSLLMNLRPNDVKGQDKQAAAFAANNNANVTTKNSSGQTVDLLAGVSGMDTIADGLTTDYQQIALHLVRMLMFNKTYSQKFGAFVGALADGKNSAATLDSVYGQSLTGLAQDLGMDWKQPSHPVVTVKFETPKVEPQIAQLSAEDSASILAGIKGAK